MSAAESDARLQHIARHHSASASTCHVEQGKDLGAVLMALVDKYTRLRWEINAIDKRISCLGG